MQFLRTLFWVLLAVVGVVFALNNWTSVPIRLWAGLTADIILPILLLITFLIGFLPMLLLYQTMRWRLRARLTSAERSLQELRVPPREPVIEAAPIMSSVPESVSVPGAVPPAMS